MNPKFAIIIYCVKFQFLEITLNSIQKQNFDNFEVILIYDNNEKSELNNINSLIKDYINIKLINNKNKKGLFYSYITGILESKGEYILTIKSGYTLSTQSFLNDIEKKLDANVDILEFNLLINNFEIIRNDSLNLYKCSHFESEINVDSFLFNKNYKKIDQEKELIVNKLIKSNVYKSIINKYKSFFIDNKIYNYFDELILFLFEKEKIQIKHINNLGIIEYSKIIKSFDLYSENNNEKQLIDDSINYINFLFNNTDNEENTKGFVVNEFYNIINIIYNNSNEISEKEKQLIFKFLNCKYISNFEKNILKTYYNALINRNKYDLIK